MPLPELATVREVAESLRVTKECVRKMCHMKRLRSVRIGGRWRIDVASVNDFVGREHERNVSEKECKRRADAAMRRMGFTMTNVDS